MAGTASDVLRIAAGEIGKSDGTKYGKWYVATTGQPSWLTSSGVPWCAMGTSWALAQAGVKCAGLPGHYCPDVQSKAVAAMATVKPKSARPGDVILFDWDRNGRADHVGIVEANKGSYVQTLEPNVGGKWGRRTRAWSQVVCVIRPEYAAEASAASIRVTGATTKKGTKVYGFATCRKGSSGPTVKMLQATLNVRGGFSLRIDGIDGDVTSNAVGAWQKGHGLVVDKVCGPVTWASLLGA